MTKHRVARRKKTHPGVKLLHLPDGRRVARWRDPLTGGQKQQGLDKLGLTRDDQRTQWAVTKSTELAAMRLAASLGTVITARVPMATIAADYLATKGNRTRMGQSKAALAFGTWCGANGIAGAPDLTLPRLLRWRDQHMANDKLAASTRNQYLNVVGAMLSWASDRGHLPLLSRDGIRQGCKRVPLPAKPIEFLRPEQVRQLLEVCIAHDAAAGSDQPGAPFVLTLLLTGARFAEIAGLQWSEIDLEHGEIRLPALRVKTRVGRVIDMTVTPWLRKLLQAMHDRASDRPPFDWRSDTWAIRGRDLRTLGAPRFTPHVLRRTCGTVLTNAPSIFGGASAWQSARRLGHSVQVAEKSYAGLLRNLPNAPTMEAVLGIEDLCQQIVMQV